MTAATQASDGRAIETILVPVDFSASASKALTQAAALGPDGSNITLLHVITLDGAPAGDFPRLAREAEVRLREFARRNGMRGYPDVKTCVRAGVPYQEILKAAAEEQATMIVLATRSVPPLGHVSLSRTSDRVSRYAACPVLLVHEDDPTPGLLA